VINEVIVAYTKLYLYGIFFTPAALLLLKLVVSLTCTFGALWDFETSLLIVLLKITLFKAKQQ
jgi:hypothetical protein